MRVGSDIILIISYTTVNIFFKYLIFMSENIKLWVTKGDGLDQYKHIYIYCESGLGNNVEYSWRTSHTGSYIKLYP